MRYVGTYLAGPQRSASACCEIFVKNHPHSAVGGGSGGTTTGSSVGASVGLCECVCAHARTRTRNAPAIVRPSVRPSICSCGRAGGRALVCAHACTCTASSRLGSRGSVTASAGLGSEAQLVQGWGARDRPAPMSKTANRPAEDCGADQATAWRRAMVGVHGFVNPPIGVTGASSVQWSALPTALLPVTPIRKSRSVWPAWTAPRWT